MRAKIRPSSKSELSQLAVSDSATKATKFDALLEEYGDMFAAGVVDPLKVTRTALENAISVAATLMTTDCLIVEAETDDKTNADSQFEGDF